MDQYQYHFINQNMKTAIQTVWVSSLVQKQRQGTLCVQSGIVRRRKAQV
jgi:hypothetical protein